MARSELRCSAPSPVDNRRIGWFLRTVRGHVEQVDPPVVSLIAQGARDPFRVLVSTLLSSRTRDEVTAEATSRLFAVASDPESLQRLSRDRIAHLIYPVGFYKTKAKQLREASRVLLDRFRGEVPDSLDELLELPGVGRKTANLVLIEGFRKAAICVDTHVHRITNIWGYVQTHTPEQTERALREKLPRRHWLDLNRLLVSFGQHTCVPVSPKCSQCPVEPRCPKIGVEKRR